METTPTQSLADKQREIIAKLKPRSNITFSIVYDVHLGCILSLLCPPITAGFTENMVITSRSSRTIEGIIPGLIERITKEEGKILFIGNGLSDIPLVASQKDRVGLELIVVDIFKYQDLTDDLQRFHDALTEQQIPEPLNLRLYLRGATQLSQAIKTGSLKFVYYCFGSNTIPRSLLDADLVINIVGPSIETISEQVQLLRIGGELYISGISTSRLSIEQDLGVNYSVSEILPKENSYVIRRIR